MERPVKVAIIGGGCGAITTAYELSKPEHQGRYEITVYQEGWRLGGKGASGRGPSGRVEEHGLHVWLGFYENAFRMMRDCYSQLQHSGCHEFGEWDQAFIQEYDIGIFSSHEAGCWQKWSGTFSPKPGLPGDPLPEGETYSLINYYLQALELLKTLITEVDVALVRRDGSSGANAEDKQDRTTGAMDAEPSASTLIELIKAFTQGSLTVSVVTIVEGLGLLGTAIRLLPLVENSALVKLVDKLARTTRNWLESIWLAESKYRHIWEMVDLVLAVLVGTVRFGLLTDPRGLSVIDDYECREWLKANGASERALASPFLTGLYDLHLSYQDGDPRQPKLAAGQSLRGTLRMFFGYRGSLFWRMRAGMGDVVFAPLYKLLKARGVKFQFFHRLVNVGLPGGPMLKEQERTRVTNLEFVIQAKTIRNRPYDPLITVQGRSCWPANPLYNQLAKGEEIKNAGVNFESHWDATNIGTKKLIAGKDFDAVVLGVSIGAIPHVCKEILARDQRWQNMVEKVKTVATQALQIWLTEDADELGWQGPPYIISGYRKPFDTWCDMAHVVPEENWLNVPKTAFYFCGVLPDPVNDTDLDASDYPQRRSEEVFSNATQFLAQHGRPLWPKAYDSTGAFRWSLLVSESPAAAQTDTKAQGPENLRSQYWRANVNPSDRYVLTVPGSNRYRLSPLDMTYTNMTITGDWTDAGFNAGCTEAAVMSGMLAAHAISGVPELESIVAFDHP